MSCSGIDGSLQAQIQEIPLIQVFVPDILGRNVYPDCSMITSKPLTRVIRLICDVAYSEERDEVATAGSDFEIRVWCAVKRTLKKVISGHSGEVTHIRWTSLRSGMWVSASDDGTVRSWFPDDGTCRSARSYRGTFLGRC